MLTVRSADLCSVDVTDSPSIIESLCVQRCICEYEKYDAHSRDFLNGYIEI